MHEYVIEGGYPIQGTVTASGNKNAALPCIAATLMTDEPVILHNIPEIQDTNVMLEILKSLGAKVEKISKNNWKIQCDKIKTTGGNNNGKLGKVQEVSVHRSDRT